MRQSDRRHGSPYDRGSADRYYGRPANPHFYAGDTYSSDRFDIHTTVSYTHLTLPTKA